MKDKTLQVLLLLQLMQLLTALALIVLAQQKQTILQLLMEVRLLRIVSPQMK